MQMSIIGINGTAAILPELRPNQLVPDQLYVVQTLTCDDEGNERYLSDYCTTRVSTAKNLNGSIKLLVRFSGDGKDYFLSQIPFSKFFGPLRIEVTGEELESEVPKLSSGFGKILQDAAVKSQPAVEKKVSEHVNPLRYSDGEGKAGDV